MGSVRSLAFQRNLCTVLLWQCSLCFFHPAASLLLKKYHGGYVVIRLALAGHKQANRPFYRIVAAYNKRARDGKYIEQLGTYDPLPNIYNEKLVSFNFDRIKYWIGCGAHPTKPVAKLLGMYLQHYHDFFLLFFGVSHLLLQDGLFITSRYRDRIFWCDF